MIFGDGIPDFKVSCERKKIMAKVKIYLDAVGNTMNIWWGNPKAAAVSEETESPANNDVIVKDKRGVPIGLEMIGVFPEEINLVKLLKDRYPQINMSEPFLIEASEKRILT